VELYICTGEKLYERLMRPGLVYGILGGMEKTNGLGGLDEGLLALTATGVRCVGKDTRVRVLVADDDARVRWAVQTLLLQEPEPIAVCECSDVRSLAIRIKDCEPDVVLLDWELSGRPDSAWSLACQGSEPKPKVVILSARPESEQAALESGADAFVCKGDPPERFLETLRSLLHGTEAVTPAGQDEMTGV
jgi:CheY-like chemotaxis protein